MTLTDNDRRVIRCFTDKVACDGGKLTTDGARLDGYWMGGRGIAQWKAGKIHFTDLGSKAAETVHNLRWFEVTETRGHIDKGRRNQHVGGAAAQIDADAVAGAQQG